MAANDLAGSSYETTIQLPAVPTVGLLHRVNPKVVYSGKLKSMTLNVAGKAGIPKSGVGGVLVELVSSSQQANIQGGDQVCCNLGSLEVVPGTKIKIHKVSARDTDGAGGGLVRQGRRGHRQTSSTARWAPRT